MRPKPSIRGQSLSFRVKAPRMPSSGIVAAPLWSPTDLRHQRTHLTEAVARLRGTINDTQTLLARLQIHYRGSLNTSERR